MKRQPQTDARSPWLIGRAQRTAGETAIRFRDGETTWEELAERARGLAASLAHLGVGRGDIVAVHLPPHPRMVALLHALQWLGATMLPLNLRLTPAERARILAHARPRLLLGDRLDEQGGDHGDASLRAVSSVEVAEIDDLEGCDAREFPDPTPVDPSRPLALVYTSGTTSDPKGVVLTNANFEAAASASQRRLGHGPEDIWLATLPLFHVGGLAILVRSVLEGSTIALEDGFDDARVASAMEDGSATMISLVPTMLARVLDRLHAPISKRVRCVLVGGASLSPSLARRALDAGLPVSATYGMTEACSQICTSSPGSDDAARGLVGRPLEGMDLKIEHADDQGWGEILLRGPAVTAGYLHQGGQDGTAIRDGWFATGDTGRLDESGRLEVSGRRSDLIVTGGENVSPLEVERALDEHPDVRESLVVGVDDPRWGQALHATVVPLSGRRPDAEALRLWCRQRLAGYKIPREIHFQSDLPRNATGKLLRGRRP